MKTTRRAVLAGAAGLAASGVFARAVPKDDRYSRAIVIDGLGSPDDPDGDKYPDSNFFRRVASRNSARRGRRRGR